MIIILAVSHPYSEFNSQRIRLWNKLTKIPNVNSKTDNYLRPLISLAYSAALPCSIPPHLWHWTEVGNYLYRGSWFMVNDRAANDNNSHESVSSIFPKKRDGTEIGELIWHLTYELLQRVYTQETYIQMSIFLSPFISSFVKVSISINRVQTVEQPLMQEKVEQCSPAERRNGRFRNAFLKLFSQQVHLRQSFT